MPAGLDRDCCFELAAVASKVAVAAVSWRTKQDAQCRSQGKGFELVEKGDHSVIHVTALTW